MILPLCIFFSTFLAPRIMELYVDLPDLVYRMLEEGVVSTANGEAYGNQPAGDFADRERRI
jgi:hypothetical protein